MDRRCLTEAALIASLIARGVPKDLGIHSDDAGQFDLFVQSLCWVHKERHYRKLQAASPEMASALDRIKGAMWELYRDLKAFKSSPNEADRIKLSQAFDDLFHPKDAPPFRILAQRLALTFAKKKQLLRVLERPKAPVHNNQSETAGRSSKIKGKVSGGTHCEQGRRAWDTFLSLLWIVKRNQGVT